MAGKPRNYCFIQFAEPAAAQKAIEGMHDRRIGGRTLYVNHSSASKDPDAKFMEQLMKEKREMTANVIDRQTVVKMATGGYKQSFSSIKILFSSTVNRINAIETKLAELRSSTEKTIRDDKDRKKRFHPFAKKR